VTKQTDGSAKELDKQCALCGSWHPGGPAARRHAQGLESFGFDLAPRRSRSMASDSLASCSPTCSRLAACPSWSTTCDAGRPGQRLDFAPRR
jgi:hypothetical protein